MNNKLSRLIYILPLFIYSQATFAYSQSQVLKDWTEVKETNLIIKHGSPLDFSFLVEDKQAGENGRVIINNKGSFALEKNPAKNKRFLCASMTMSVVSGGFPSKNMAKLYVSQLKKRGYNLVRLHVLEAHLMHRQLQNGKEKSFDFNEKELDKVFYFLAELKKQGIYWLINGVSSPNGAYGGITDRWSGKQKLKQRLYHNSEAKQHWKDLVSKLYGRKNKYTGLSIIEDPALLGIILVNENGMNFLFRKNIPEIIRYEFNEWLKIKYKTTRALNAAWKETLTLGESLENLTIRAPKSTIINSIRQKDFQQFTVFKEHQLSSWQTRYLRSIGYEGLITGLNNWPTLGASKGRSIFDWIDMHSYHDENFMWGNPHFKMKQTSSFKDGLRYLRHLTMTAQEGKPFTVSEWGHVYWNKYRHESGLIFSSFASFQNWDMICQHSSGAVDLSFAPPTAKAKRKMAIYPYSIGMDPVLSAGEVLSALLYLRGDVSPSKYLVLADYSGNKWLSSTGEKYASSNLTNLSFLTGFRINLSNDLVSQNKSSYSFLNAGKLNTNYKILKEKGWFAEDNKTNLSYNNKIFQTDTNQIYTNLNSQEFWVSTPKTIGVILKKNKSQKVGKVTFSNSTGKGMIAMSAIDGKTLKDSSKILIIITSDARSTGMELYDNDRKIKKIGRFPVLLKNISLLVSMPTMSNKWNLTRLSLTGQSLENMPIEHAGKALSFNLQNYSKKFGATTYFLLENE